MKPKFSESVSALQCRESVDLPLGCLAGRLHDALSKMDFHMDEVEFVEDEELVLEGNGMILSVCRVDRAGHHVLIAAETPFCDRPDDRTDKMRLLLCATATRVVCQTLPVESISWWHMGKVHVTEGTRHFAPVEAAASGGPRAAVKSALSAVKDSVGVGADGFLARLMKRHFPSADDVVVSSDRAA